MAGLHAIHSVGNALIAHFRSTYPQPTGGGAGELVACGFALLSSGELVDFAPESTMLTLYLYRVGIDPHARNRKAPHQSASAPGFPLALELHFLLTVWSESAQAEHQVLAWAMRELHARPILDRSILSEEGGWDAADEVRIVPAELGNEDLMRIWDALAPSYRLSVPYVARVVRIDSPPAAIGRPVVATRLDLRGHPARAPADA